MEFGRSVSVYLPDNFENRKGTIRDVAEDTFGIRRIEADAENGFRLNGKKMKKREVILK